MTPNPQGQVDALDFSEVYQAGTKPGPKVTCYVPTEVASTQTAQSGTALNNLLKSARTQLLATGVSDSDADSILAPAAELVPDTTYWRLQSRGFAAFAAPGFFQAVRVPVEVAESVTVGERFHLLPLADVLAVGGRCYILALTKNSVRLFDAGRNTIEELSLGSIPSSFDDVIGELPEAELQGRSVGRGRLAYHGQSDNTDTEQQLTERFIAAVGKGVGAELGTARSQPLVLAAVAEYLAVFRESCPYPVIHDQVIAGSPERTNPDRLRSAAWRLLRDRAVKEENAERERAMNQVHAGRGAIDIAEIARAAADGKIHTLYLPRDASRLTTPDAPQLADQAILHTVRFSGTLRTLDEWHGDEEAIATFRY